MDTLKIIEPPEHNYKLIVVPGERLNGQHVSDFKFLESKNKKYKIIDRIELMRGEFMPTVLIILSAGQFLTSEDVFKHYQKSNNIYFFLCET